MSSASTAADGFHEALRLHQAGQLDGARASYERILRLQPTHTGALHYLGVIASQQGDQAAAARLIGRAIELEPRVPLRHFHLAGALHRRDDREAAVASYSRAIDLKPDFTEAYANRGIVLCELGRRDEALADYDRAVSLRAAYAEVFSNRGDLLRELGRLDEALADCEHAIRLRPGFAQAYCHRGLVLMAQRQWDAALSSFAMALASRADYAEAHFHRGVVLQEKRLFEAAVDAYRRAIAIRPQLAAAHANLGLVLRELGDPNAALASIDTAIRIAPGDAASHVNRGVVLQDLRRWDEARASYDHAAELAPDQGGARYNRSMLSLLRGDFAGGWADFESRWTSGHEALQRQVREFGRPLWLGKESLAGRSILLHAEQGLGDTIQFCRYASLVAAHGAEVHLEVPAALVALMRSLPGVTHCFAHGEPVPCTDFHCPLMSLPLAFGTTLRTVPARVPYLAADPDKLRQWSERLGPRTRPRVGLVWSGGFRPDQPELWSAHARRNITLARLASLRHPGIEFHSLQKGEPAESELAAVLADGWNGPPLVDHARQLHDFSDTAALIANLDLVISVDTSTAHLAGALGRPVWILNRYDTCWRWLLDREDSPWYPTVRLYRQQRPGDWDDVLRRVQHDLAALAPDADGFTALYGHATGLLQAGHAEAAAAELQECARLRPSDPRVWNNFGLALAVRRQLGAAIEAYDRALSLQPAYPRALNNRALAEIGRYGHARALADLDAALALEPGYVAATVNRGVALSGLGRRQEALDCYRRAFPAPQALANAASILRDMNRGAEAQQCSALLYRESPDTDEAAGTYHEMSQNVAAWTDYRERIDAIVAGVRAGRRTAHPFPFLSVADSPADQLLCAQLLSRTLGGEAPLWRGEIYRHPRIRVAYLSSDLGDHATTYLALGLFERHDRARFDIHGLSYRRGLVSPEIRARLRGAFEHFEDVQSLTARQLAAHIRGLEIDILVDLKGHTADSRVDVLAHRCAPVQVHYLGYPGTLGSGFVDYLIADRHVVPPQDRAFYAEHIVYLPHCYQVTDDRRPIDPLPWSRERAGLTADGPVLCAFHQVYKINPPVFDVWMRLLDRLPGATLWLLATDPAAQSGLAREAAARGIDPRRLVFAGWLPQAAHLARLRVADLYLDTWPVGAHTSASDALWAGVPVIALQGRSFAARVSSSILHAAGASELIAESPAAYEDLVYRLCTDPGRLAELRRRLAVGVRVSPLFDTARFTRDLESAYVRMRELGQSGAQPRAIPDQLF